MDRKATAKETLAIMNQGYYVLPGEKRIEIRQAMEHSIKQSILITPEDGIRLLEKYEKAAGHNFTENTCKNTEIQNTKTCYDSPLLETAENISTVDAIRKLVSQGYHSIGVLNFASAKNPGGGFINGAMAQEESLAASSTLYRTLTVHEEYYRSNQACRSMIYTNHGIYSPDVVFFRDGRFRLAEPVKASVLTLPAVNMGQVIQKGENVEKAKKAMKQRMKLALAIFAEQGAKNLILGAYGCGVFRNDPAEIATWWKELLAEGMDNYFNLVFYAVLDCSKGQNCINAFRNQTCFSS